MEDLFDLFESSTDKRASSRKRKRPSLSASYALKEAMGQDTMGEYTQSWMDIDSHLAAGDDFEFSTKGTGEKENFSSEEGEGEPSEE